MDGLERYATPLNAVFSRQHKLDLEHRVELALLLALSESGLCPAEAHAEASAAVAEGRVTLARTLEIERETQHDIMAVVKALTEQCPRFGGFVHFGATSQDVNDTVLALQMGECRSALLAASRVPRGFGLAGVRFSGSHGALHGNLVRLSRRVHHARLPRHHGFGNCQASHREEENAVRGRDKIYGTGFPKIPGAGRRPRAFFARWADF